MRQAYFTHGTKIDMTLRQAVSASHAGDYGADVAELLTAPEIARQLDAIDDETMRRELGEYGCWEADELESRETNKSRLVWLAANEIADCSMILSGRWQKAITRISLISFLA